MRLNLFWVSLSFVLAFALKSPPGFAASDFAASTDSVSISVLQPLSTPVINWDNIINPPPTGNQPAPPPIMYGVQLQGPSPYDRNDGLFFTPASNTKLFTSGLTLSALGPDYRIETKLTFNQVQAGSNASIQNLTLIGSGDPSWGMSEFGESLRTRIDTFVAALSAQGVKEVRGPITIESNDTRWDLHVYPQGWQDVDYVSCYGAPAQSFNLQLNCANYSVTSPTNGYWVESGVPTPIRMSIQTGATTRLQVSIDPNNSAGYLISGTLEQDWKRVNIAVPVLDTKTWVKNLLSASLSDAGIKLTPTPSAQFAPAAQSFSFYSPPVGDILKPFMKDSINVIGDAFFKYVGEVSDTSSANLILAGQKEMASYLNQLGRSAALARGINPQLGYYLDQVTLYDGAGVSRDNLVTTSSVMTLLEDLSADKNFPTLWNALPIAGVDGTLAHRMNGTVAENYLRAKTGTLQGVYNLSGYVPTLVPGTTTPKGYVPFVILSKGTSADLTAARAAEDRVGVALSQLVKGQPALFDTIELR